MPKGSASWTEATVPRVLEATCTNPTPCSAASLKARIRVHKAWYVTAGLHSGSVFIIPDGKARGSSSGDGIEQRSFDGSINNGKSPKKGRNIRDRTTADCVSSTVNLLEDLCHEATEA